MKRFVFPSQSKHERLVVADFFRLETVGGALLILATIVALTWANSPWADGYQSTKAFEIGPLDLEHWAKDGMLAIFFYVVGVELKRELVVGTLRRPAEALVPVVAALCGMIVPASLFVVWVLASGDRSALRGWAIPTATDIAFALAVLAVVGSALPSALRAFLLTLAVVDDLAAITVIAVFFTDNLDFLALAIAVALCGVFAWLQHRRVTSWWLYVPLALVVWWFTHESGVHATVAGVALGLLTRVRPDPDEEDSPAERLEHRLRPISAGIAVPLFALFAAGVPISGSDITAAASDPAAVGVVLGLVFGKIIGIFGGSWLTARLTNAELNAELAWMQVLAVSVLAGIGFTVALLICELAFPDEPDRLDATKAAVLIASLIASVLASVLLRVSGARYQRSQAADDDTADDDTDNGDSSSAGSSAQSRSADNADEVTSDEGRSRND